MSGVQHADDFRLVGDLDHQLRDQPVETGVAAVGQSAQRVFDNPRVWEPSSKGFAEAVEVSVHDPRILS